MAEPVRKIADWLPERPERELPDEEPGITVQRWVEGPGGKSQLVELPLTPELFLNPQVGDQMTQGKRHSDTAREIADLLDHFFRSAPDVLVTFDLKHLLGPGLPEPSPDVSVIRGVRDKEADRDSFDIEEEGVAPCLVVEVVSPLSSRIRQTDLVDKVDCYSRAGIAEYLIADCERRDRRFRLLGYRLDTSGRYRRIEPDEQGRLLSETTGLFFQASPDGRRVLISESSSGRLLLPHEEEEILRKAAEERARIEAEARKAAEEEITRLRPELQRLHPR